MDRRAKQIIVISRDEALHQRVAQGLAEAAGHRLLQHTADLSDVYALGVQGALDLILLDWSLTPKDPVGPVRDLRQRLPEVPVVVLADAEEADYIRRALLAGARAFLPLQFSPDSLRQTIDDLVAVHRPAGGVGGRVIVVFSLKGGVGRTLIATNLAVQLQQSVESPVVLVDRQLLYGDVGVLLNLSPQHTMADLVDQAEALEPEMLNAALARHASGVRVLSATDQPQVADRIRPAHLASILRALRSQYAWVVVDTGTAPDDRLDACLEAADTILLVTTPEMTALRAARLFLQAAREETGIREKARLVINRADLVGAISVRDIQRHLGLEVYAGLKDDSALVAYSINRGVPLVLSHRRKPLARGIRDLAASFLEEAAVAEGRRRQGLFSPARAT